MKPDFTTLFSPLGVPLGRAESFEGKDYKERLITQKIQYMLNRTQRMFEYEGLPDGIPRDILELYLQTIGYAGIIDIAGNLFVTWGTLGGVPNEFYRPTKFIVANPGLQRRFPEWQKHEYTIGEDCVIIRNDSLYMGLYPAFNHYANMLTENEITMHIDSVNRRIVDLLTAENDSAFQSAKKYLADVSDGKQGAIMSQAFMDGIKAQPYGGAARGSTELIEIEQYWNGQWLNFCGLNANFNMKREAVMSGEAELNDDALLPLTDEMLYWREQGLKDVEEMFGLAASVSLACAWSDREAANDIYEDKTEAEAEKAEAEAEIAQSEAEQAEETDTETVEETTEETEAEETEDTETEEQKDGEE